MCMLILTNLLKKITGQNWNKINIFFWNFVSSLVLRPAIFVCDQLLLWSHTPLAIDPCVLILFRRVEVACLYPFRQIQMRDFTGECVNHERFCVMWNPGSVWQTCAPSVFPRISSGKKVKIRKYGFTRPSPIFYEVEIRKIQRRLLAFRSRRLLV